MAPAVTARGRVTDPDGDPIQDSVVRLDFWLPAPLEGIRTARTDEQGRFERTDLAAYNFQMKVSGGGAYGAPSFRVEHPDFAPTTVHYHTIPFEVDVVMEPAASSLPRLTDLLVPSEFAVGM